jgi:hypothetical protein
LCILQVPKGRVLGGNGPTPANAAIVRQHS